MIVCTYRREESLRRLLEDLLVQEDVAPEILVVDQTPRHEPETDALLARHADRLRHVRIAEPNLPNARNEGIARARGEIVVFIDDDLRVPRDFLRRLVVPFDDPAIEGLAPLVVVAGEQPAGAFTERFYGFRGDWRSQERIRVPRAIGACMAFRLEAVRRMGGFEALLGRLNRSAAVEDYEFCGRWVAAGHRLWLAPRVQALHLGDEPGGCEMRHIPGSEAERHAQRGIAFMVMKQERSFERLTLRTWLRLLRMNVLRRDVLRQGPAGWLRACRAMLRVVDEVRAFWREQGSAPSGSPRSSSGRSFRVGRMDHRFAMQSRAPRVAERVYRNAGNLPLLDLLPAGGGRALDCGCGAGDNARILKARGWRVTGITLSAGEERLAAEHCDRVFVSDLEQPLPPAIGSGYDAVVLSHVLEHLVDPAPLLAEVRRVLAPGGVVGVALPNVLFYPIRLGALRGRFDYTTDEIMDATHLRFYTFASGAALLRANGFEVAVARADGGFPLWKLRRALPAAWVGRIDRAACRWLPGMFGRQSVYLARPRGGAGSGAGA